MGPDRVGRLQKELGPLIVPAAVNAFFTHWPEKVRSNIEHTFYQKLNDAEIEYASCKSLVSEVSPIDDTALCSRLAKNILTLAVYDADVEPLSAEGAAFANFIRFLVCEILDEKNLGELVEKAGAAIITFDDYRAGKR